MGYIEDLRALIGHRRIILNSSVVVIRDGEGRVLLQERAYPKGNWSFPGGLMELGESTQETARREVLEETGLTLGRLTLLGVYSGEDYLCVAANGDEFYVVCAAYTTDEYEGEAAVSDDESLSLHWIAPDALPDIARTQRRIAGDYVATLATKEAR